ncbi:hypothetical protein NOW01_10250 [Anoxybacillus salavatliensis]|nr:hypothetical protein [Anoxybacillus gonensis]MCQ5365363.1 hypothetical protein [Anoxybacillus gonensis]
MEERENGVQRLRHDQGMLATGIHAEVTISSCMYMTKSPSSTCQ